MHQMTKRVTALAGALVLATGLTACNRGAESESDRTVVLALSTLNNPYFISLRDGAQEAADKAGVTLEVVDAQNDAATQANQLANAATQQADAVIVNPVDSAAAAQGVEPLLSDDIPVIAVDRGVDGAQVTATVASDNVDGGKQAGDALVEAIGGSGDVLQLQGVPGTDASRDRGAGFEEAVSAANGVEVVAKQPANFDRATALNVATNLLEANSEVKGIFAENDEMALGAVRALGPRAGKQVQVIGFDATPDGLDAVEAGTLYGTIAQDPGAMGATALEQALQAVNGEDVPETTPIEVTLVTQDNVADFQ